MKSKNLINLQNIILNFDLSYKNVFMINDRVLMIKNIKNKVVKIDFVLKYE